MTIQQNIDNYIAAQPEAKQQDLLALHRIISELMPGAKLWYLVGKNADDKIVSNPNIGYGSCMLNYADGSSREFYQLGMSANKSGISMYVFGLDDKTFLAKTFGGKIGKAQVTGYCIKFKKLEDLHMPTLKKLIKYVDGGTKKSVSSGK